MADLLAKSVKPAGGDYTTLEACMHANEQDLVSNDKYLVVTIDGDWSGTEDTTSVVIDGYTTDPTRYIKIFTAVAARHSGVYNTDYYRIVRSVGDFPLDIRDDYVWVDGIQIQYTVATETTTYGLYVNGTASGANAIDISNTIIKGVISNTVLPYGMRVFDINAIIRMWNCILYGFPKFGIRSNAASQAMYNCTISDATSGDGFDCNNGTLTNCAIFNNLVDIDGGSADYCATDDLDGTNAVNISPGGTEADDWNDAFTDYANGDFSVKDDSSVLDDAGTDNPGSGLYSDDIAGNSRVSAWDIGAFELAVVGASTLNVSESPTVSDTVTLALTLEVNVSESITIADTGTPQPTGGDVDVSESITVEDSPTPFITTINLSVSESITIVDSPTILPSGIVLKISVSESITLYDSVEKRLIKSDSDILIFEMIETLHPNNIDALYALVSKSDYVTFRDVYNGAWEALPSSDISDNAFSVYSSLGGIWHGAFPSIETGWYYVQVRERSGANPASSDNIVAVTKGYWDGVRIQPSRFKHPVRYF